MRTKKNKEIHFVVSNLIKIRNDKRLNQAEFSELVGIDYTIYNKIESGQLKISLEKLSKIAINLHIREIDIFTYPRKLYELDSSNSEMKAQITIELKENLKEDILNMVFQNKNLELIKK